MSAKETERVNSCEAHFWVTKVKQTLKLNMPPAKDSSGEFLISINPYSFFLPFRPLHMPIVPFCLLLKTSLSSPRIIPHWFVFVAPTDLSDDP